MRNFNQQQQLFLAKRLAFLTQSGITIEESLKLCTQFYKGNQKKTFDLLLSDLNSGIGFSRSLTMRFKGISELFVSLVSRGEQTGTLHQSFKMIVHELSKRQQIKRRLTSAMIYPLCISLMTVILTIFLIMIIFPKMKPLFLSMHTSLPWNTLVLINVSTFISTYWWLIAVSVTLICIIYRIVLRFSYIRWFKAQLLLFVPIISQFILYKNLQTICSTLHTMLKTGSTLPESLASLVIQNPVISNVLTLISAKIQEGKTFSTAALLFPRIFSQFFIEFIMVTEVTGNVSEGFMYMSEYYDQELEQMTKLMTTLFEPFIMACMGIIVGFVALSMILPMYGLTQNLSSIH